MLNILLDKAQKLKAELDAMRPLSPDAEGRVMQKLRIDWNYHSNNMEGNSLTYGETRALLLYGMTAKGKPLNDHLEISGHQAAIDWLVEVVKKEAEITEHFIRSLHQIIFGGKFHDSVKVGAYKDTDNFLITKTNETLRFTSPEETPFEMQNLVTTYQQKIAEGNDNPIVLAAAFHYEFVRIHPFEDGNGRMSRLLMNFILMRFGYPPAVIKTEEKESYYTALQLADAEKKSLPLAEYLSTAVIHSLELMLKGARGESIEEPSDLNKQLAMLEHELILEGNKIEKIYSQQTLLEWENDIFPIILDNFKQVNQEFDRFYLSSSINYRYNQEINFIISNGNSYLYLDSSFQTFKILLPQKHKEALNYTDAIFIRFNDYQYEVGDIFANYYHVKPTEKQLNLLAAKISEKHLHVINTYKKTKIWEGSDLPF
jgi:Fic family protein